MSNVCSKPECCGPTTSEIENLEQQVLDLQNMLGESYSKHDVADMENEIKELKAELEKVKHQHEKDLALASFDAWRGPMIEDGIDYCVDDEVRWWNKHYWHQQSLIKDIFDEMYEDTFGYKYNIETRDYDVPDPSDEE